MQTFAAEEVIDWIDDGETPVCPYCGVDAVLPGETDLARLWTLRQRRFGRGAPPAGPLAMSTEDPDAGPT